MKMIIKWIAVSIFLFGLILFIIFFQEYRRLDTSGLSIERVRHANLVGDFIYPTLKVKLPVVVFLGGSGGGVGYEEELKSLALSGYSVLSLAYLVDVGLPNKLENIPLEYFENAFNWLKNRKQVDITKLLLLGVSRGAELALLLGSYYPQVRGVIAYSPSCFVLPNATEVEKDTFIASWTFEDKPIPFAPIRRFKENTKVPINYRLYIEPLLEEYNSAEEYIIKVEKINGPILLIPVARI